MSQSYTAEFKAQVIHEVRETQNATMVARRHPLSPSMVRRWSREVSQDTGKSTEGLSLAKENAQLKRLVIDRDWPGVVVDIVDVSPQGGIADPGPQSPAFSGRDGSGGPLTVAGMETTMQQYQKTFGTLNAPNIHLYVAPQSVQTAWNVQSYPTLAFLNDRGKVVVAPPGAQTLSQAQSHLQQALGGGTLCQR